MWVPQSPLNLTFCQMLFYFTPPIIIINIIITLLKDYFIYFFLSFTNSPVINLLWSYSYVLKSRTNLTKEKHIETQIQFMSYDNIQY